MVCVAGEEDLTVAVVKEHLSSPQYSDLIREATVREECSGCCMGKCDYCDPEACEKLCVGCEYE